jgi:hypothetical protein
MHTRAKKYGRRKTYSEDSEEASASSPPILESLEGEYNDKLERLLRKLGPGSTAKYLGWRLWNRSVWDDNYQYYEYFIGKINTTISEILNNIYAQVTWPHSIHDQNLKEGYDVVNKAQEAHAEIIRNLLTHTMDDQKPKDIHDLGKEAQEANAETVRNVLNREVQFEDGKIMQDHRYNLVRWNRWAWEKLSRLGSINRKASFDCKNTLRPHLISLEWSYMSLIPFDIACDETSTLFAEEVAHLQEILKRAVEIPCEGDGQRARQRRKILINQCKAVCDHPKTLLLTTHLLRLKKIQLEEEMDEILKERYIEAARQHVVAVQEAGFSYAEDNQLPIGIEGLRLKCPPSWQRVVNILVRES